MWLESLGVKTAAFNLQKTHCLRNCSSLRRTLIHSRKTAHDRRAGASLSETILQASPARQADGRAWPGACPFSLGVTVENQKT